LVVQEWLQLVTRAIGQATHHPDPGRHTAKPKPKPKPKPMVHPHPAHTATAPGLHRCAVAVQPTATDPRSACSIAAGPGVAWRRAAPLIGAGASGLRTWRVAFYSDPFRSEPWLAWSLQGCLIGEKV